MTTLVDRLAPLTRAAQGAPASARPAVFHDLPLALGASVVIALSSQIAVPLPFSPVPLTAQTLALLLLAAALGRARATAAALCYLAEGVAGLPVFAGGASGPQVLLGPTGGYLAAFVPAAWLVGALAERGLDRRFGTAALAMLAGNAVILALGAAWLARFVGPERALLAGVLPFLAGDFVKAAIAAALLPAAWRALDRFDSGRLDSDVRP